MNEAQHLKYRICGAQAVAAMRRHGYTGTHSELTALCRRKALGIDKPSTALNNIEFDSVLAVFAGWHSMADLAEQLRILDQPLLRILHAAKPHLDKLSIADHGRENYLAAIYTRVQARRPAKTCLAQIPDDDFPLVLGALNHTVQHKTNPRSAYRRKSQPPAQAPTRRHADTHQPDLLF